MRTLFPRSASLARQLGHWWLSASVAGGSLLGAPSLCAADAVEPSSASPATSDGEEPQSSRMQQARRMLLERAKQRYDAGRGPGADARQQLEGALDALRLAYQLSPASWLLFNLAQVQSQLGACNEASELYRGFLASEPGPEARASAEQALRLLGTCSAPDPQPSDAALLPVVRAASALDSLSASGVPLPPPAVGEPPARDVGGARLWPWALAGVAVTAGAAATVFYGEAREAQHDLERIRVGGPQVEQTRQRGESSLALARAFGGAALGFAIAAGASFCWPHLQPDDAPAAALARLSWLPLEHGAGATYSVDF